MLLSDYITQVQELVHDSAGIDYTTVELTNFINNARKRVALDFHCVRSFFTGLTTIVGQETYPMTGAIAGAKVVLGGGGFSAAPTLGFPQPPIPANTATGIAIMSGTVPNQVISSVAMTNWGSGYLPNQSPSIVITPPNGAVINATYMINVIDFLSISFLFGVQRTMLQWKPFTLFQAVFRANLNNIGQPAAWSNYTEANLFYLYPIPDQNYTLEIDAIVIPNPLVNTTDNDLQIVDPMADCVEYYAAHLALLKAQNFEQAEYYHKKYKGRQMEVQLTRQSRRITNPYQTFWRRLQRGF